MNITRRYTIITRLERTGSEKERRIRKQDFPRPFFLRIGVGGTGHTAGKGWKATVKVEAEKSRAEKPDRKQESRRKRRKKRTRERVRAVREKGWYPFWKRTFDIVAAIVGLVLLSPVLIVCLFVKFVEDGGAPVYVSWRVGKDGKLFRFYKIRTMKKGAEKLKNDLIEAGLNEADGPVFKMKNDPRITKFGKFLRKTSLDETLQLINVLNGSMSLVGPRPPLPEEVEKYTPLAKKRLSVKGGLLCLWQIQKNRHEIGFDEWLALDLEYIRSRSFALDMKILWKGAYMVLFDRSGE